MIKNSTLCKICTLWTISSIVLLSDVAVAQFASSPPKLSYAAPTNIGETNRLIEESDLFAVFIADYLPWDFSAGPECSSVAEQLEYYSRPQRKVETPAIADPTMHEQALVNSLQTAEEAIIYRHATLTEIIFKGLRFGCFKFPQSQSAPPPKIGN